MATGSTTRSILRGHDPSECGHLVDYHPYWKLNEHGVKERNPACNADCRLIMDLKSRNPEDKRKAAARHFFNRVDAILAAGVAIACVPSHDPNKAGENGIYRLAAQLAHNGRIDASGCLVRHVLVAEKHSGGSRDPDVDRGSIRVEHPELIRGRLVLLMDDITTTGGSLEVSSELLLAAGAIAVQRYALGRTV